MAKAVEKIDVHRVINRDFDPQDPMRAWRDLAFYAVNASMDDSNPALGQVIAIAALGKLIETLYEIVAERLQDLKGLGDWFNQIQDSMP